MYKPFRIGRIYTNMNEKTIILQATHHVLEKTVTNKNIQLYEESSRTFLGLNLKVDGKNIIIELNDYPVPNTQYVLIVSNLQNVLEEELDRVFKRNIIFKSRISSKIKITNPSDHETIEEGVIEWIEDNNDLETVDQYYLEIAKDPAFYEKVIETVVTEKNTFKFNNVNHGQFFVRVRAQDEKEYGQFSETVSFYIGGENIPNEVVEVDIDSCEDEESIFSDDLHIIETPIDGHSGKSFKIYFNKDIDPEVARHIKVYRRTI